MVQNWVLQGIQTTMLTKLLTNLEPMPLHGVLRALWARPSDTIDQTPMAFHLAPDWSRISIEQNFLASRLEKIAIFRLPLK